MRKAQRRAGAGSDPDPLPAAVTTSLELPRGIFWVWAARTPRAPPEEFGRRKKHLAEKARDVCDWRGGGGGGDILPEPGARIKIRSPSQPTEGIRVE